MSADCKGCAERDARLDALEAAVRDVAHTGASHESTLRAIRRYLGADLAISASADQELAALPAHKLYLSVPDLALYDPEGNRYDEVPA